MRQGAITITRAYVDAIQEERVRLVLGESVAVVPAALLPDGVCEGEWIEVRIKGIPESVATDLRPRRRAASNDL